MDELAKTSPAKLAANKRYDQKAQDRISIKAKKEVIEAIKAHCKARNCSVNGYIIQAVLDRMYADMDADQEADMAADRKDAQEIE